MLKSDAPGGTGFPGLSAEDLDGMDLASTSRASAAGAGNERTPLDDVEGTADIVLWRARRHAETIDRFEAAQAGEGEQVDVSGWVCLEGDPGGFEEERGGEEKGQRRETLAVQIRDMKMPVWERWVDVYVR